MHDPAEVTASTDPEEVLLTFTYEEYGFTPEQAESIGERLIQQAALAKEE